MRLCVKIKQGFLHMLTATKHIFKTTPSNFTPITNDLINSDIPPTPKSILLYLLSQPDKHTYNPQDLDSISKQLGLTNYARKKALKYLLDKGYLRYQRLKAGYTSWQVSDKPQQMGGV
jgi:hypothetical protein